MKTYGARHCRIAIRGIASGLACAAILAWFPGTVSALDKIKFGTGSAISLTSAPLTMAISMGYFKEEGLDVEVIPFRGGSGVLIPQIVNKSIDVGFPTLDVLMIARQPGRDYMPLKFFYNVTRTSIYEVVVLDSSPVKTLADLKGKKIGVGALSWGNIPITKAMFKDMGVDPDKDVELIAVGQGPAAYQALTSGRIDALNLFDVPHAELESLGTKIRRLPLKDKFVQLGSNSLIAHDDTIKARAEMLARVGRAIAKGTVACNANVPGCVKAFWELYPTLKPTQGTEEEKLSNGARVLATRLEKMLAFPAGSGRKLGEFPPQMWRDYIEVLHSAGQLSTTTIPVESLYTNEFVPQFNSFDAEAVVRAAKAAK
jgi:NitT/TauT family transport system substrate-binding protein